MGKITKTFKNGERLLDTELNSMVEAINETYDNGITSVEVSVDNKTGTPSATSSIDGNKLTIDFHNLKGEQGEQGEQGPQGNSGVSSTDGIQTWNDLSDASQIPEDTGSQVNVAGAKATATAITDLALKTSQLDYNQEQLIADDKAVPDYSALPLLCGQPPILYGEGTPQEAVVPLNWNQYDPDTDTGYNWNGEPSALGQVYINISVTSGGRYTAVPSGVDGVELKWVNF